MTVLEKNTFYDRRVALKALMSSKSIAIVSAAREVIRSRDTEYQFRQSSDFLYLTGFYEPDAILVMGPGMPDRLFVRPRDPSKETWNGRLLGPERVQTDLGIEMGLCISDFEAEVQKSLNEITTVEYPFSCKYSAALVDNLIDITTRGARGSNTITHRCDLGRYLARLRVLKSTHEIEVMREASRISAYGHIGAMEACKAGMTEDQLAAIVEYRFRMEGSPTVAYQTIVGSGDNACILHYVERTDVLRDGEMVLVDAGCEVQGYAGDITRSFPVNGQFSKTQAELYDLVLAAQQAAIAEMQAGKTIKCFHNAALRIITQGLIDLQIIDGSLDEAIEVKRFLPFYMHGTGHFLGLDVHDVGCYDIEGEPVVLEAGMVITCEPGLYISNESEAPEQFRGVGIRIEDDILIKDKNPEILTSEVPKTRADIEALMRGY